ncbi:hypothetical protein HDA32_000240 [Spinactinospora alkalitolerans]|uniref:Peptidase n=1 Tax=Spinactinospora alkalitolerans TaxID=687207 RepID=A0A852TT39_9ACTN|nr:neutral zinc metallopeptidase [Spinactinospora alkalitolerans]NYE45120.1 hypothetical protein [Spinactinospora alkalitolerans]
MTERGGGGMGTTGRGEYRLPSYARRPRQRLGMGIIAVLITGLGAVGLAGFVTFASAFDDTGRHPVGQPVSDPPGAGEPQSGGRQGRTAPDSGEDVLGGNPLYRSGEMAEATCEAPRLDAGDAESMEVFLHTVTDCLDEAWTDQFGDSELPFEPPNRIYWYASGQSPCGNYPAQGSAAFYCQANKGLYLGVEDIVHNSGRTGESEAYTFLLSHEYGHHVQGEAGILDRYHAERGDERSAEERDAWTRKSELQANCLGGTFLGAAAESLPVGEEERANILKDARLRSDHSGDHTHGSPDNGQMWTDHGMDRMDPAACNTWEAGKGLVE